MNSKWVIDLNAKSKESKNIYVALGLATVYSYGSDSPIHKSTEIDELDLIKMNFCSSKVSVGRMEMQTTG